MKAALVSRCVFCDAEHDPFDTGEWGICPDCYPGALTDHAADRAATTEGARA